MAGLGQALDQIAQLELDPAIASQLGVEIGQLLLRGQIALEQQPGRFLKAAFAGQRLDGDAAILQAGILPSMKLMADSATGTSARPGLIGIEFMVVLKNSDKWRHSLRKTPLRLLSEIIKERIRRQGAEHSVRILRRGPKNKDGLEIRPTIMHGYFCT